VAADSEADRVQARDRIHQWLASTYTHPDCGSDLFQRPHPPSSPVDLREMEGMLGAPSMPSASRVKLLKALAANSGPERWRFWSTFEQRRDFIDADVPMIVAGIQASAASPQQAAGYLCDRLGGLPWARVVALSRWASGGRTQEYWPRLTRPQLERLVEAPNLDFDRPQVVALLLERMTDDEEKAYLAHLQTTETADFMADVRIARRPTN
jgi:hypothetical protein